MKKTLLLPIFLSLSLPLLAQNPDPLVKIENDFEKTCLEKGIRDGFLAYVDSNGVMLTKKGTQNAKHFWSSLPVFDGIFTWSPAYVEMSISGDWGYTTGNYEHRPKTMADPASESGQYTTVWHKTASGEWKYLIDIGNNHPPAVLDKQAKTISKEKYPSKANGRESEDPEKEFILSFENNIRAAYQEHASTQFILNLIGHQAITSRDSAVVLLDKMQPSLKYHPLGSIISPGKDMLAVYGTFGPDNAAGNYLRIWRHEKDGWKLALEVIKI